MINFCKILDTILDTMEDGEKTVSRIISEHCGVSAHLKRFSIVDGSMCVCLEDHETGRSYNMEMLPFFVSKSMPDSEIMTVGRLQGGPNTRLVCPIELEGS
jgi:hypothetical protein